MCHSVAIRKSARRGFTIIEVTISILVLTVAAYILSSTIGATLAHTVAKREQATAVEAAMNTLEALRAAPFIDVFALYDSNAANDPLGPGTAPGPTFAVPGLEPIVEPGGAVRPIGRIILPETRGQLREDADEPDLGLPRDLNGDLIVDSLDHVGDYLLLPAIVRIEWSGRHGARRFEMATQLVDLQRERELR